MNILHYWWKRFKIERGCHQFIDSSYSSLVVFKKKFYPMNPVLLVIVTIQFYFFFNSWFSLKIFLNLKLSFKVVYDNFLNTNTRNKKEHAKTNPTETHTSYDTRSLLKENPFALLSSFNSSLLRFVLEWRKCLMLLSQRNGKQISFQYQIRPQRPAVKVISINLWRW